MKLHAKTCQLVADTYTPVSAYLKLRDTYPNSFLLESADRHSADNATSYIAFNPLSSVWVDTDFKVNTYHHGNKDKKQQSFGSKKEIVAAVEEFIQGHSVSNSDTLGFKNGFFGMMCFESLSLFEDIDYHFGKDYQMPLLHYTLFQNVLVFNHFTHSAQLYCFSEDGSSNLQEVQELLQIKTFPTYGIKINEERQSNISDKQYMESVARGKKACRHGDVFQVVLSRGFSRGYLGDEFNLYRALRTINPSPYMFYFDFSGYKLLGASPESQLKVNNGLAEIAPIAGTVKRTGKDSEDALQAEKLLGDAKEASEHVMLVDLARNDLSKIASNVEVAKLKEVHYYSHVIHLVSNVRGYLNPQTGPLRALGESFPAGTLSGAPKYRAIEIIRDEEQKARRMYGGAVGFIGLDGSINHAIFIRSAICQGQQIFYQAGAGVVDASSEEGELNEVEHKVGAMEKAIRLANENFGL